MTSRILSPLNRQRGVSLIEVALASAVLGICAVLLWGVSEKQARTQQADKASFLVGRAHDALLAYAYLNGHLPCPASTTGGQASCDGNENGFLPYLTLGLPAPEAGRIRYRVSMSAPSTVAAAPYEVIVGQPSGEHADLEAHKVTLASLAPADHDTLLDLCASLGGAAHNTLAYALTLETGTGTGTGTAATVAAAPPGAAPAGSATQTESMGRGRLAVRLGCAPQSAGVRSHFTAALGGQMMARAMMDYRDQFEMGYHTYAADLAQGVFFMANAMYGTTRARTKMIAAKASSESSNYLNMSPYLQAQVAFASSGIYAGAMISNVARFSKNIETAKQRRQTIGDLKDSTQRVAMEIQARALQNGSRAFSGGTSTAPSRP
jgi:prepilin-type N-terminal cleavage/methylation domain-containing protein